MDGQDVPDGRAAGEWPLPFDWPEAGAADMGDSELLGYARLVYRRFRVVPRWAAENDDLLRRWAVVCREMAVRGMTDTVTEGSRARDAVTLARDEDARTSGSTET